MDRRHLGLVRCWMFTHWHPHGHLPCRISDHKTTVPHQVGQRGNRFALFGRLSRLNQNRLCRVSKVEMVHLAVFCPNDEYVCTTREGKRRHSTGNLGREINLGGQGFGGSIRARESSNRIQPKVLVTEQRCKPHFGFRTLIGQVVDWLRSR